MAWVIYICLFLVMSTETKTYWDCFWNPHSDCCDGHSYSNSIVSIFTCIQLYILPASVHFVHLQIVVKNCRLLLFFCCENRNCKNFAVDQAQVGKFYARQLHLFFLIKKIPLKHFLFPLLGHHHQHETNVFVSVIP